MGHDSGLQSPDSVSWPSAYDIFEVAITGFRPRRNTQVEGRGRTGEGREVPGHQLRHERRGGEEAGAGQGGEGHGTNGRPAGKVGERPEVEESGTHEREETLEVRGAEEADKCRGGGMTGIDDMVGLPSVIKILGKELLY